VHPLIERNTTIPTQEEPGLLHRRRQPDLRRGQRPAGRARDGAYNKSLGRFHLDGIAPARRGVPQIEVTFDIDANGIVNVSAKDLGTGKEQHITITASSNLSKEDIDKAVKEAEQYAAEDKARKEEADARNNADQIIYQSQQTLSELGDKVSAEEKAPIEAAISDLQEKLKGTDVEAIKSATEAVTQAFYAISEKLYANHAQADVGAQPGSHGAPAAATTAYVDADFEEVD
jgi:Molecular chaperone